MKKLIVINGTMGAGKTAVCSRLLQLLQPSVFLDGDWCWNMNPFVVNKENKKMVQDNIDFLLRSFLHNSGYEYVLFCWVIHQEEIFDLILDPLSDCLFELHKITLMCSPEALERHLHKDIMAGTREPDVLERSLERLPLYEAMHTQKLDVSTLTARQAAENIVQMVKNGG